MVWVVISIVCLLIFGVCVFLTRNYQKTYVKMLDKKEHSLKVLYSLCLFLLLETRLGNLLEKQEKERELLSPLCIGEDVEEIQILHWCKKLSIVFLVVAGSLVCICATAFQGNGTTALKEGRYIERQKTGQGEKSVTIRVSGEERQETSVSVTVPEQAYTEEELAQKMEEAKAYVNQHYLGENKRKEEITTDLNFITAIPDNAVTVSWSSWNEEVITEEGELKNGRITEETTCTITAQLAYGEISEELNFDVVVLPAERMSQEDWEQELEESLEKAGVDHQEEERMELPETIGGEKVSYQEPEEDRNYGVFLLFGLLMGTMLWLAMGSDLKKKYVARDKQMLLDYPELVNKFTLLLGAGMTVNSAWGKIAGEYEKKLRDHTIEKRYAYEEWRVTWGEMSNGMTNMMALERFGQRAKLIPYLKFSTLLSQNLRKGTKGLLEILEHEALDAFESRKQATRQLAEEAGTKLLAPMMIMLILVMVIIMAPAMMSL